MAKKTKLSPKVLKYLDEAKAKYGIIEHRTVYTAIDAANTLKKKLNEVAKSLLIKADKDYYLVIIPADRSLDFEKLGKLIGKKSGKDVKTVKIPGEKIMEEILKVKAGAISAFGKLHKLPVVLDDDLSKAKSAIFSSGSFNHSVEMAVKDFIKLEDAIIGKFSQKKNIKPQKIMKPKKAIKPAVKTKAAVKKKAVVKTKSTAKKK